ncbi:glycosyltransferase family 25 protein [Acuticoccus sediminis]|uniref:glycosyltransferase family 25 protein n=1 Tax=Acuticoccus sediminis TaxID=2184697 RepID=UPI001CFD78E3|nr:glycosyltransferase family 25 protein [Acuticoccus sediminis]
MKTYYINREVDDARRQGLIDAAASFETLELERIEAVDGHRGGFSPATALPDLFPNLPERIRDPSARGYTAVFMSHAKCWRKLLESDRPYALIVEDDVRFTSDARSLDDAIVSLDRPFDIIFVNSRANRIMTLAGYERGRDVFVPVDGMYANLLRHQPAECLEASWVSKDGVLPAPGGDGYVLSRAGARRLLDYVAGLKQLFHVDVFLFCAAAGATLRDAPHLPLLFRRAPDIGLSLDGYVWAKFASFPRQDITSSVRAGRPLSEA